MVQVTPHGAGDAAGLESSCVCFPIFCSFHGSLRVPTLAGSGLGQKLDMGPLRWGPRAGRSPSFLSRGPGDTALTGPLVSRRPSLSGH